MHDRHTACPRILRFKPPRIALSLLAGAILLHIIAPNTWPSLPSSAPAGGFFAMLGLGIMLRAWWLFRTRDTAICPTAETRVLITDDVYRLTRNPMYLGIVMLLAGVAVAVGSPPYYIAAVTFFVIVDFAFCPFEEAKLHEDFGVAFDRYCYRVRRWL